MSQLMGERIAELSAAPHILRAFQTRLDLNRSVLESVKNFGTFHSAFYESALRGYTALQQVTEQEPARPSGEVVALVTEQEVCLAGAVAVAATAAEGTQVEVRILHVVERVDQVLS